MHKALEPFNGDKAVHGFQLTAELGGDIQVFIPAVSSRLDLEDDDMHGETLPEVEVRPYGHHDQSR